MPKQNRNLSTIYFYSTQHCNLLCRHCWLSPPFIRDREEYVDKVKDEITLDQMKWAIDEALELGLRGIKLTGGEPFLRPDVFDFIEYFHKKGLHLWIETNGTLIDRNMARVLQHFNISQISVSIDGPSATEHDKFRGIAGSFDKAIKAIKLLVKYNIPVQIIFSLYRGNLPHLWETISLARSLKVRSLKINPLALMGRALNLKKRGQTLNIKELLDLNKEIEKGNSRGNPPEIMFDLPPAFQSIKSLMSGKGARCNILNILGILADGSVSFCGVGSQEKELIMGNIKWDSLRKIWHENEILKEMRTKIPLGLEGICKRCIMKHFCLGFCRAQVFTLEKNFTSSPWFCEQALRLRLFPQSRLMD